MAPRKQTQIAERELEILRIASDILHRQGLSALTMENVLARVDFSKGTLYNHFRCREDLLVAFHTKCCADHQVFFERGALFHGRPRERFVATAMGHEVKCRLDPQPFRFALTEDALGAASERWRDEFLATHHSTMGIFLGIVRDGIACGDLPEVHAPEFVACSTWATAVGADELHDGGLIFRDVPRNEFSAVRSRMVATLLDGFLWQPLSRDHDYAAVRERVLAEIYGPEAQRLGLLPEVAAR